MAIDPEKNKPLGDSLGEIVDRTTKIVHEEIELAKAEMALAAQKLLRGSVAGIVGGVFAFFGLFILLIAFSFLIADAIGVWYPWLGFFIVAFTCFILGAVLALLAYRSIKAGSSEITPTQAIDEAKQTRDALQKEADKIGEPIESTAVEETPSEPKQGPAPTDIAEQPAPVKPPAPATPAEPTPAEAAKEELKDAREDVEELELDAKEAKKRAKQEAKEAKEAAKAARKAEQEAAKAEAIATKKAEEAEKEAAKERAKAEKEAAKAAKKSKKSKDAAPAPEQPPAQPPQQGQPYVAPPVQPQPPAPQTPPAPPSASPQPPSPPAPPSDPTPPNDPTGSN